MHLQVEQRTKARSYFQNLNSSYLTRSVKPQKALIHLFIKTVPSLSHHFYCTNKTSLGENGKNSKKNKQPHTNADVSQLSRVCAKNIKRKRKYGKGRKTASAGCAQDKEERLQFSTWPSLVGALTSLEHPVCPFQFPDGTTS